MSVPIFASYGAVQPTNFAGNKSMHMSRVFALAFIIRISFDACSADFLTAHATRVREAKSSSNEAYSRASSRFPSADQ